MFSIPASCQARQPVAAARAFLLHQRQRSYRLGSASILALILAGCGGGNDLTGSNSSDSKSVAQGPSYSTENAVNGQSFMVKKQGALSTSLAPTADAPVNGMWTDVGAWPLIAIHTALLPDGRVMTYGTTKEGQQTAKFHYDIWDASAGDINTGHTVLPNSTGTDIFCSSQVLIPGTGDLFIAGGDINPNTSPDPLPTRPTLNQPNNNTTIFFANTNNLQSGANLQRPRWYSSSIALTDGNIYIQGGSGGTDFPELRKSNGVTQLLSTAGTSALSYWYPHNFLSSDGRVFGIDSNGKMYYVNTAGNGNVTTLTNLASGFAGTTASAAMFAPGRVIQGGGNSKGTVVVDFNGTTPNVIQVGDLSSTRKWLTMTMLPTGKVLATGGSEVDNTLTGLNTKAEIWDPTTGNWTTGAAAVKARLYHSTALLLPDASVLIAGGGAPGPQTNTNAEIYYPSYLFNASAQWAARPVLTSVPTVANPGDAIDVQFTHTSAIQRVTMVKTGSVTHSFNFDQLFIEPSFSVTGNTLKVQLPANAATFPPGYYMLFALDAQNVPSIAKIIKINIAANPRLDQRWHQYNATTAVGGSTGTDFVMPCYTDEVMVGVVGRFSGVIDQVSPLCARVDKLTGRRLTDPYMGGKAGGEGGSVFYKECPGDSAVSGFVSRSGTGLTALDLQCSSLKAYGQVNADKTLLGAVGGTGDTNNGLTSCPTGTAAIGLAGKVGTSVNQFALHCAKVDAAPVQPCINGSEVIAPLSNGDLISVGQACTDNSVVLQRYRAGKFIEAKTIAACTAEKPGLSTSYNEALVQYVSCGNRAVQFGYSADGGQTFEWEDLGFNATGAPTSTWRFTGDWLFDVLVRGTDNALWKKTWDWRTGWSSWQSLGGCVSNAAATPIHLRPQGISYAATSCSSSAVNVVSTIDGVTWSNWQAEKTSSQCAVEGGRCTFTGTRTLRFGADSHFVERSFSNGADCNATAFGLDPIWYKSKACYLLN